MTSRAAQKPQASEIALKWVLSPRSVQTLSGRALATVLRTAVLVLGLSMSFPAQGAAKAPNPAPPANSGFTETSPPSVELGVNAESPAGDPEAEKAPGTENAKPVSTGSADSDVDISEIGRLMDAQNAAGSTAVPTPGRIPTESRNLDMGAYALRAIASLAVVLALIVLATFALRKYGRRSSLLTALAGPGLATVLGKVHLARGTSLHYVETGGRVLVVGVTPTSISLVAEFDAAVFDVLKAETEEVSAKSSKPKVSFLQQLLATSRAIDTPATAENPDDPDIALLRGDIERLQKHLQELSHDSRE